MEDSSQEDPVNKAEPSSTSCASSVKLRSGKPSPGLMSSTASSRRRTERVSGSAETAKPRSNAAADASERRKSTGGIFGRQQASGSKRPDNAASSSITGKRTNASTDSSEPLRRSLGGRSSLPSSGGSLLEKKRPSPASSVTKTLSTSTRSETRGQDNLRKPSVRSLSFSGAKSVSTSSIDSSGSSAPRKTVSKVSSPATPSPSVTTSRSKAGSLSSSVNRASSLSGRRKTATPDSRDSRFIVLPQVEIKAGDDVRLDLRGHRVRSLTASGLNLSSNLEFVYLRDNLLSSLEGIEILTRVKVLDLSFNDFKGPGFEPLGNCKVLQQLYLAGNQITSLLSLPQLPNLEFLSVAQNKLKSLSMASQPRLQVLAASKNKISTLKGFPHLPVLEHLRVEENPILDMPHLEAASILLVGPTLKKFNDRDLSFEELEIAKRYPAHTALCIRDGWEFCRPELAADSTLRFLVEQWKDHLPPGYVLKEASVDRPFEEDACHCRFIFAKDRTLSNDSELVLKYQWFIGEKTPINFLPISGSEGEVYWPKHEDIDKFLKVECTPILRDTAYPSIFAVSSPVSPGTGLPKVLNLSVHGELVEGNVIKGHAEVAWCGGTPGKGVSSWLRRRWNNTPVVIVGAEEEEYQLTINDIDSSLVFMYTPVTEEGAKGEPQYAMTDFVKAAAPSVSNVQIMGDVIEGNTIFGAGEYFGGREGPSKFQWFRKNKEDGELKLVSDGTSEFTLTKDDVGHQLSFVYIPINFEGQEGESASIMTSIVKKAPPKASNLKIIGDIREGNKVTVAAVVTGGTEGFSRVQWFKTRSSKIMEEDCLEALTTPKVAKAFRIPVGALGHFLVVKFTPMAPDGQSGEPVFMISENAVETLPPSLNFLAVTGDCLEGKILTASYGYIGGHEGKSLYDWFIHEAEADPGVLIPEASGHLEYHIVKDAIGKFISFKCTPVREDGTIGDPKIAFGQERVRAGSPMLLSLQIVGEAIEGTTLHVDKKYWGGEEGDSVYHWFLTSLDGTQKEIEDASSAAYTLSARDIGFLISVSCDPIRIDLAHGATMLSEQIGPVKPGPPCCQSLEFCGDMTEGKCISFIATYTGGQKGSCSNEWFRIKSNGTKDRICIDEELNLTVDDVGSCIELVYTPSRSDGLKGVCRTIVSDVIAPADPIGIEIVVPECCEDVEVVPKKLYYGGNEGDGEYIWYRTKLKLQDSDLINISEDHEDVQLCARSLTYIPSLEDVGYYLALYWVPTRVDGKCGKPLVAISSEPVSPAFPVVSDIIVEERSTGLYCGGGRYHGGHEGSSLCSWYRQTKDGNVVVIDGANSSTYSVSDSDYTCCLIFGYTPVRSDFVVGELKLSQPTDIVLPEAPKIEMVIFSGKAMEGEKLTAIEIIPNSDSQQHVWSNYKKEIKYQWSYSIEDMENKSFQPVPSNNSCSYKLKFEDIGRCLKCECVVADVFGRSSEPVSAESTCVIPGIPRVDKLEIEGRGFHTNLYAVRGNYFGGKEGKSRVQWLRAMVGSPDLISIPGEVGRMYEANVDDVGYRVVVLYTPVREDGIEGQPISASTEPISVEPDILKEVKQMLDLGSVKFDALCNKGHSLGKVPGETSFEKRILEVNRKRVKVVKPGSKTSFPATDIRGTYAPPFHVELFRNDQHRLRIVVDSENEVDLMVKTRHMRDVIVLVIRGLAQKFNSTSLNSLLKVET
ncbi:hypothetical protein Sjap_002600 [Stephania japonica]|uniref:187-kDa microtubule-associated protein AIR9 n=1 Tax=Stephania japonica TaxID=461633 RepID=A0AAP0KN33_9MAGN